MTDNPFAAKPTITDQDEEEETIEQPDPGNPQGVQENYDRVPPEGNEVEDPEEKADEEWAGTPVELYASLDAEKIDWVFVTLEEVTTGEQGEHRPIPYIENRFDEYAELEQAREDAEKDIPEGFHIQGKSSDKIRYVKGQDAENLLKWRDLK